MRESWVKLHIELLTDEKLTQCSGDQFKLWICLLLLARKLGDGGVIHNIGVPAMKDLFSLRCSTTKVRDTLEYFQSKQMIEIHDKEVRILNYEKRQAVMDQKERNAARQRKWYAEHNKPNAEPNTAPNGTLTDRREVEEKRREEIPPKPPQGGATRLRRSFSEKPPAVPTCTGCREQGHWLNTCPRKAEYES